MSDITNPQSDSALSMEGLPGARSDAKPAVNLTNRLRLFWVVIVLVITTIPLSLCVVINHWFNPTAHNFKRWAGLWARIVLRSSGIRVDVTVRRPLDSNSAYVFVSNHQNALDILVLAGYLPYPFGFVAKKELAKTPFLGLAIKYTASLLIDRSDPRKSLESIKKAGRRIKKGNSVLLFPEGSRSYSPRLLPFKKGAFLLAVEAGVPLVPVAIVDSYRLFDQRSRTLASGKIHMVIEEPISTEGKRRRDASELMEQVQEVIAHETETAP